MCSVWFATERRSFPQVRAPPGNSSPCSIACGLINDVGSTLFTNGPFNVCGSRKQFAS